MTDGAVVAVIVIVALVPAIVAAVAALLYRRRGQNRAPRGFGLLPLELGTADTEAYNPPPPPQPHAPAPRPEPPPPSGPSTPTTAATPAGGAVPRLRSLVVAPAALLERLRAAVALGELRALITDDGGAPPRADTLRGALNWLASGARAGDALLAALLAPLPAGFDPSEPLGIQGIALRVPPVTVLLLLADTAAGAVRCKELPLSAQLCSAAWLSAGDDEESGSLWVTSPELPSAAGRYRRLSDAPEWGARGSRRGRRIYRDRESRWKLAGSAQEAARGLGVLRASAPGGSPRSAAWEYACGGRWRRAPGTCVAAAPPDVVAFCGGPAAEVVACAADAAAAAAQGGAEGASCDGLLAAAAARGTPARLLAPAGCSRSPAAPLPLSAAPPHMRAAASATAAAAPPQLQLLEAAAVSAPATPCVPPPPPPPPPPPREPRPPPTPLSPAEFEARLSAAHRHAEQIRTQLQSRQQPAPPLSPPRRRAAQPRCSPLRSAPCSAFSSLTALDPDGPVFGAGQLPQPQPHHHRARRTPPAALPALPRETPSLRRPRGPSAGGSLGGFDAASAELGDALLRLRALQEENERLETAAAGAGEPEELREAVRRLRSLQEENERLESAAARVASQRRREAAADAPLQLPQLPQPGVDAELEHLIRSVRSLQEENYQLLLAAEAALEGSLGPQTAACP
eukprot:TRINITY_DN7424_c5_g1_i1.p1 TRINITY_DN7424_c5_g1~~TRINITY_DN7424_c5_g1_i1.p1  ORF type:complete len:686 (+),score=195.66 TRINITY_DN7424_c5_g1_i1:72-2129(+)